MLRSRRAAFLRERIPGSTSSSFSVADFSFRIRFELSAEEKRSLVGGLRELRRESISSAGRRLAAERLGERTYMEMPAAKFFAHCYDLRSRLVHGGEPRPSRQEVGSAAAALGVFVSELLTEPFFRDGGGASEEARPPVA
jgi:hypothetical protein